jgi:hypothetical protein
MVVVLAAATVVAMNGICCTLVHVCLCTCVSAYSKNGSSLSCHCALISHAALDDHTVLVNIQLLAKSAGQKRKGGPVSSTNESAAKRSSTNGTSSSTGSSSTATNGSSSSDTVTVSAVTAGETAIAGMIICIANLCSLIALLLLR